MFCFVSGIGDGPRYTVDNLAAAADLAEQIIELLPDDPAEKIEIPALVYFVIYQVFEKIDRKRASNYLETAHTLLQQRSERLDSDNVRQFFLEEMPLHREILEAYHSK